MRATPHFGDMSRALASVTVGVLLAAASPGVAGDDSRHLGAPFTLTQATPIEEITADPGAFHDRAVRIEGRIASVCTQEGCFVEVVPEHGGEGIVVNFPGLVHTFPTDCAGLEAAVEGRLYRKIYPRARVDHWQHHSFRPGVGIPEFSLVLRMDASSARIGGERSPIPPPVSLREVQPDRVDLAHVGFETRDLGIDRRRIAPGEAVPRPSPGDYRWLVLCREGEVTVDRRDAATVAIRAGELFYSKAVSPRDRH